MNKMSFRIFTVLMMVGAFAVISFAQTKERVQLKVDSSDNDLALQRTLAPNGSLTVTFRAIAGQTVSYTAGYDFKDSDLRVSIWESGANDSYKDSGPKENNEFLIPKTGNYDILIENTTNKRVTTTLYLNLFSAEFMAEANSGSDSGSEVQTEALDFTGSDQANVNKTIPANGTMKFTFDGAKGATAIVRATDKTNKLTVIFNENPNDNADTTIALNRDVSRKLTRTGEYTIEVINDTNKAINLGLEVSIGVSNSSSGGSSSGSSEVRVQFASGETSTMVTKDIPAKGSVDFLINVRKGQTMDYTIGYDFNDSDITAYLGEPGDQDVSIPAAPKAPQSFVVKKSGDHRLEVTNTTKKKVTMTLYLDVE